MNKRNMLLTLVVALWSPFLSLSQSSVSRPSGDHAHDEVWEPANAFPAQKDKVQSGNVIVAGSPMTNVLNGVSFYGKKDMCNSQAVVVLKAFNVNSNPVKITWQLSPSSPEVTVVVPAHYNMEGSCMDKDVNKAKMIIPIPDGPDKEEVKKYFFSHITVTEVKK